jgi:dsRNA-specific ribonuclease
MINYINILREYDIKRTEEFNKLYLKEYGFDLPIEDIALSISTYDKIYQSGYKNELPALFGDLYLEIALYKVLIEDYNITKKGKLNQLGQHYLSRDIQSKYMLESGMADYIIVGNSTNLYVTKNSPKTLHSIFENIIYLIHEHYGIEGVKNFIRKANYL